MHEPSRCFSLEQEASTRKLLMIPILTSKVSLTSTVFHLVRQAVDVLREFQEEILSQKSRGPVSEECISPRFHPSNQLTERVSATNVPYTRYRPYGIKVINKE